MTAILCMSASKGFSRWNLLSCVRLLRKQGRTSQSFPTDQRSWQAAWQFWRRRAALTVNHRQSWKAAWSCWMHGLWPARRALREGWHCWTNVLSFVRPAMPKRMKSGCHLHQHHHQQKGHFNKGSHTISCGSLKPKWKFLTLDSLLKNATAGQTKHLQRLRRLLQQWQSGLSSSKARIRSSISNKLKKMRLLSCIQQTQRISRCLMAV
mmetsp:Transcript_31736/g.62361  ORF Transcript_31736/g.62361 Transcript_31736/m.62361 type:complete len:208 (-) Transcript_31736:850-1473(-)